MKARWIKLGSGMDRPRITARSRALCRAAALACAVLLALDAVAAAAPLERETLERLDRIRAVKAGADAKTVESYNRQMDEAWKFFSANKASVLPVLRRELSTELRKAEPSDLLLLDVGYFLSLRPEAADKALAKRALLRLDTGSEIVRANRQELFDFAYAAATDRDPALLPLLDKAFLRAKVTAFVPQHALTLDETLVCVFLYGLYGRDAETHLRPLLADRGLAPKVIEILIWIGTPDSLPQVKAAMTASRDYETFVRATAFMMQVGGPQGRAIMLAVDPQPFDQRSREYYAKVRKDIEAVSYRTLRAQFAGLPGALVLGDDALKKRLQAMYEHFGRDDTLNPEAILNSGLSARYLIGELLAIRARTFRRLSDEALSDVTITNALVNTLRYRTK